MDTPMETITRDCLHGCFFMPKSLHGLLKSRTFAPDLTKGVLAEAG